MTTTELDQICDDLCRTLLATEAALQFPRPIADHITNLRISFANIRTLLLRCNND